jgi:hypothetical protein
MNLSSPCVVRRTVWVEFYVGVGKVGHVIVIAVVGRSRSRGRIFNALFRQGPGNYLSMDIGGMPGAGRRLLDIGG